MQTQLTLRAVIAIARTYAKVTAPGSTYLNDLEQSRLAKVIRATAASLATLSRGGLAPEVRLSEGKVRQMLWTIYKAAKAEAKQFVANVLEIEARLVEHRAYCVAGNDTETIEWIDGRLVMWAQARALLAPVA